MSDDRETPEESPDEPRRGDDRPEGGDPRDGPLGDLAAEVRERTGRQRSDDGRPPSDARPGERPPDGRPSERQGDASPTSDRPADGPSRDSRREGPLADLASEVDERRRDGSDAFESVEVGDLDGERLWEQVAGTEAEADAGVETEADGPTASPAEAAASDDSPGDRPSGGGRDVRTVSKDTCHRCPHFGDPPELACTNEGTEILAMPDADRFRVADCPMVDDEDIGGIGVGSDDALTGE